ncbi:PREDICTED: uncharacterized protein OsI_027940 [Camelina sativa]|uniref:Co-chaperone protein p23 n=1 Tax=Camelina sativa TaxID=90675 RepID=A0ABM0X612_CAMSA|nr:PREDICTED: uncharacterized protein OsI_027940 [Camelina sativa]
MSHHPEVKWAERADKVYLTVQLTDAKDADVKLDPEGVFNFSAKAGSDNQLFELKLELNDKVNVEESKINIGLRSIFCILEKAEPKWWNKLLRGGKPPHYVKVDWDKWVDEDEDTPTGPEDMDMGGMGGMDFSNFGGMGGMGGMEGLQGLGGMGGMGGMEEFEDSDDEGEEAKSGEKKEETQAPAHATEEAKTEEQTAVKSDK